MVSAATAPDGEIDLWAPVVREALPRALVDAMEQRDWANVRIQLATVMDGITTDGVYGRALLLLALELPVGVDPVFDSYRAAASIDHGDWNGLRRCLAGRPVDPVQLLGMRDVLLAPLNQVAPNDPDSPYAMQCGGYDYQLSQMHSGYRRWALSQRRRRTGLSEGEVEVLHLAGTGLTNRDIAERLSHSQHTVPRHLANARGQTRRGQSHRSRGEARGALRPSPRLS